MTYLKSRALDIRFLFLFFLLLLPVISLAKDVDFNTLMENLKKSAIPVITLTKAFGYIAGIWLAISGVQELKKIGQQQTMMGSNMHAFTGPLMRMAIGFCLMYFPSTLHTSLFTLWGDSSILKYSHDSTDPFDKAKEGVIVVVQALGYISFVRGFLMLSKSTSQQAQQGVIGKGTLHIIGGILAINIVATIKVIKYSFGM